MTDLEDDPSPPDRDPGLRSTTRLVGAARGGDRHALEALFERYLPRVRQIVAVRLGKRQRQILEVDDIAQETLLKIFQGLERFEHRSEGDFRNWLARLVECEIADAVRYANAKKRGGGKVRLFCDVGSDSLRSSIFPAGGPTPSEAARAKEREESLEDALIALPRHHREVIVLRRLCGLSYEEIAAELGFRQAETARKAYSRAMGKLKESLERELGSR